MNDNNISPERILPFNTWLFGSVWVILHIMAYFMLDYLSQNPLPVIVSSVFGEITRPGNFSYFVYGLLLGSVTGILIGTVQWYWLQYYIEWPKTWILATVIGSVLVGGWYNTLGTLMAPGTEETVFLIGGFGGSALIGLAQWFVLRDLVDYAYLWIVIGVLSGFIASFVVNSLYFSGLMSGAILSGYDWQVSQIVSQIVIETIKISSLIGLLYITLKRNPELVT